MAAKLVFSAPSKWLGCAVILSFSEAAAACPSLTAIYPGEETEWSETLGLLEGLFDSCLQSAEYFALRGAAQLNTGALPQAIESLERALLLDAPPTGLLEQRGL